MESSSASSAPPPPPTDYRWESPSAKTVVHLSFEVVDRLNFDVMKGFGAVPRRGAEVGGILLGTVEQGEQTVVRIEDNIAVACEHLRGPSYVLSEADMARFDEIAQRYAPGPERQVAMVGYYRSNTRETMELAAEDRTLLETRLQADGSVCLLIKPFATRFAEAVFHVREEGAFPEEGLTPFPFRRKEMGGGVGRPPRPGRSAGEARALPTRAVQELAPRISPARPAMVAEVREDPEFEAGAGAAAIPGFTETPVDAGDPPEAEQGDLAPSSFRSGWIWIPLSFIFLLLGVVLGFQIAISFRSAKPPDLTTDAYSLELKAERFGESLHLKWSIYALPLVRAERGVLTITDGESTKSVELNKTDLARGSVLYRNMHGNVRFKLEVFPRENNSVAEVVDLQMAKPSDEQAPRAEPRAEKGRRARQK